MFKIEEIIEDQYYYALCDDEIFKIYDWFTDKWLLCSHIAECNDLVRVKEGYDYDLIAVFLNPN